MMRALSAGLIAAVAQMFSGPAHAEIVRGTWTIGSAALEVVEGSETAEFPCFFRGGIDGTKVGAAQFRGIDDATAHVVFDDVELVHFDKNNNFFEDFRGQFGGGAIISLSSSTAGTLSYVNKGVARTGADISPIRSTFPITQFSVEEKATSIKVEFTVAYKTSFGSCKVGVAGVFVK